MNTPQDCIKQIVTDSDDWDDLDTMAFAIYNGTTAHQFGDIPPGTKIDYASIDFQNGIVEFYNASREKPFAKFNIEIKLHPTTL